MKLIWAKNSNVHVSALALVADCCAAVEGLSLPCGIYVMLTDDCEIRNINQAHRNIDQTTDVLSFPMVNYPRGKTASHAGSLIRHEYSGDDHAYILGEIFISYDHVISQAQKFQHSTDRELCYLLAHGIFHLFGYDHQDTDEQKEMRAMEEKALQLAGLPSNRTDAGLPSDEHLIALAKEAMLRSYSPYSHYKVGACLLSEDRRIFTGTNIENASFGMTICAERVVISKAVSDGVKDFSVIAIAAESSPPWPCGACRQVLNEFAPAIRVLIAWGKDHIDQAFIADLLPHGFGPKDLP